jgi:hypothetical protein
MVNLLLTQIIEIMYKSAKYLLPLIKGKLMNIFVLIILIFPLTVFALNPTNVINAPIHGQKVKYFSKLANYGIKSINHSDLALASKSENIRTLLEYECNAGKITDEQVYRYYKKFNSLEKGDDHLLKCLKNEACNVEKYPYKLAAKENAVHGRTRTTKREEEIYQKANVSKPNTVNANGENVKVRQKDIDPNKKVTTYENGPNGKQRRVKKTNCDLMKDGYAPYAKDGSRMNLHHNKQENVLTEGKGYFVELSDAEHKSNKKDLHFREPKSKEEGEALNKFRDAYWKMRYQQICI